MHLQYALRIPFSGILLELSLLAVFFYFIASFTMATNKRQIETGKIYKIDGFHPVYLLHCFFGLSAALLFINSSWIIYRHYKNKSQIQIYSKLLFCTRELLTTKTIAEQDPNKKRANIRKYKHSTKVLEKLRKDSDIKLDIGVVLDIAYMAEDMALATGAVADHKLDELPESKSKSDSHNSKMGSIKSYRDLEDAAGQESVNMDTRELPTDEISGFSPFNTTSSTKR